MAASRILMAYKLMETPSVRSWSRMLLVAGVFVLGAYLQARGVLPSILRHSGDVVYLARQHLALAAMVAERYVVASLDRADFERNFGAIVQ